MELILTVVRYQNFPPQSPLAVRFGIAGGTIGRNSDNELVLTDPERWVGRQHARIDFRDGAFFLTDTSKNGTFVNNTAELHEGQQVELHDGDELSIGAYEIRVSREVSQPQSAAAFDSFGGDMPESEPLAHPPSGGAVPDILDLVKGTPEETDPFPSLGEQKAPAEPADWLAPVASPQEQPWTLGNEHESLAAPVPSTQPDHTPDGNAFYSPPEAIPEDYDLRADESHQQSRERNRPADGPESPTAADTQPVSDLDSPLAPAPLTAGLEPLTTPAAPDPASPVAGPEFPTVADTQPVSGLGSPLAPAPLTAGPESLTAPAAPAPVPPVAGPEFPTAPTAPHPAPRKVQPAPASSPTKRGHETPPPAAAGEMEILRAFLAGLDAGELPADRRAQAQLMRTTGQLLRAMTEGLMQVLMGRTSFKNELHLEMTTIRSRENNPFKFSVDPKDALVHLLFRPSRGFLPPLEATREAFNDIQCHELALVAGLRATLHALLKRVDPAELENRFRDRSVLDNLMPMARKAKYWDLFTQTYQEIAADAADDFMNLFRDAFTRAYEDQAARLKQARPPDRTQSY